MSQPKTQWEIEVGNEARVTELRNYFGSPIGAIKAANKRWKARNTDETTLVLRRPGCQPTRFFKVDVEADLLAEIRFQPLDVALLPEYLNVSEDIVVKVVAKLIAARKVTLQRFGSTGFVRRVK